MEGRILPLQKKEKKKLKWKILEETGSEIIAEGTDIITEEDTKVVHVYDGSECILVTEYQRIEVYNDPRLEVRPPKVKAPRKRKPKV